MKPNRFGIEWAKDIARTEVQRAYRIAAFERGITKQEAVQKLDRIYVYLINTNKTRPVEAHVEAVEIVGRIEADLRHEVYGIKRTVAI